MFSLDKSLEATLAEAGMSSSDGEDNEIYKASDFPAIVMVDEETGNKYMRMVPFEGLGENGEAKWAVNDLHAERKAWGRPGGGNHAMILNSDGDNAIVTLREALAKKRGGNIPRSSLPKANTRRTGWSKRRARPFAIWSAFSNCSSKRT
mgnify:CR=1 FL=1